MKHLSLFLCIKYLCTKKIVLLSIVAVAMSCALLITVASLFAGFIDAVENSTSDHMGDIVIAAPAGVRIPMYDKLISVIEQNPLIDSATAVLTGQGLLHMGKDSGNVRAVRIWGIEPAKRAKVTSFADLLLTRKNKNSPPSSTFAAPEKENNSPDPALAPAQFPNAVLMIHGPI